MTVAEQLKTEAAKMIAEAQSSSCRNVLITVERGLAHTARMSSASAKQQHCDKLRAQVTDYLDR